MPGLPYRPCKAPGCGIKTKFPNGYCDNHQDLAKAPRQHDNRKSAGARGYGRKWREGPRVQAMKATGGLCQICLTENIITQAQDVHHIDGNPRNNDPSNLVPLCRQHHRQIHAKQGISIGGAGQKSRAF